MKFLSAFILILGMNAHASNCDVYEAQVEGTILEKVEMGKVCTYKVSVKQTQENMLCPLGAYEIESQKITGFCNLKLDSTFYRVVVSAENRLYSDHYLRSLTKQ